MMAELALAGILAVSGLGMILALPGDFGRASFWIALPMGVSAYLLATLLQLVISGTFDPKVGLMVTGAAGGIGLAVSLLRRQWSRETLLSAIAALGLAAATVLVSRIVHLTRLTPDSLRYLLFASDMQLPDALNEIHPSDLINRQMGLPALHALASLTDRRYLPSIGPLFGVSGIGFFAWFCWSVTRDMMRRRRWILVGAAVLFLLSSNRLVYDVFYINTHIEVAFFMLLAIAGAWLAVTTVEWTWALPAGLALAMTLVFRPEAAIVAAIVLVALAASEADRRVRLAMTAPTLVVAALWHGVVLWQNATGGSSISLTAPVFSSLLAVVAASLLVVAGGTPRLHRVVVHADRMMLVALLVALVGMAATDFDVVTESLGAAFQNTVLSQGLWLFTWSVGVILLTAALIVHQVPASRLWVIPIVAFGILWLLLPLLREDPWRVGPGDSGNRLLAHMLPVVVALLVLAANRSWSWVSSEPRVQEVETDTP